MALADGRGHVAVSSTLEPGDRSPGEAEGIVLATLAVTARFTPATVTRYGMTTTVHVAAFTCLWYSVFGSRPV